jgi:hypothetical protein
MSSRNKTSASPHTICTAAAQSSFSPLTEDSSWSREHYKDFAEVSQGVTMTLRGCYKGVITFGVSSCSRAHYKEAIIEKCCVGLSSSMIGQNRIEESQYQNAFVALLGRVAGRADLTDRRVVNDEGRVERKGVGCFKSVTRMLPGCCMSCQGPKRHVLRP